MPCLRVAAARSLSLGLAEMLDGEGLPQSRLLSAFIPLVACWTRCRLIVARISPEAGEELASPVACWDADAEGQYPLAVREAVRLEGLHLLRRRDRRLARLRWAWCRIKRTGG